MGSANQYMDGAGAVQYSWYSAARQSQRTLMQMSPWTPTQAMLVMTPTHPGRYAGATYG
jgi:hypothetical protein